MRIDPAR